jgi:hypothetical protein
MSALIYAAIVAMWACFLVPMWLRRQDVTGADAFDDPLDRAAGRRSAGERVLPRRAPPTVHDRSHERPTAMSSHPRTRPPPRRLAVRRRVLLGLLLTQLLTVALGVAAVLPAWTGLLVLVPLAAYVTHLRAEARRTPERESRAPASPAAPAAPVVPAPVPRPTPRPVPARESQLFDLAAIEAAEAAARATTPAMTPTTTRATQRPPAADTWDPVPVPPPTYVMKSRAALRPPGDSDAAGPGAQRAVNG